MRSQLIAMTTVLELVLRDRVRLTCWNSDIHPMLMSDYPSALLYESALWRTRMQLPNAGRKITDWLIRGFIRCDNLQVFITWSITGPCISSGAVGVTMRVYSDRTRQRQIDGVSIVASRPVWMLRLTKICSKTSALCFTPSNWCWRVRSE